MTTVQDIINKVRRLTGRPSDQQITDEQIKDYINTFYLYDMPESLRLFSQETVFEFMTIANVDTYDMSTQQVWTGVSNQNAIDVYITIEPPAYIAGYQSFWTQSREQFLRTYPELSEINDSLVGDERAGPYTITLANTPVIQSKVTVGAIDNTNTAINCVDVVTDRSVGTWKQVNTNLAVIGSINYLTGTLSVQFANPIPNGNKVTFTAVPYVANRPQGILFYDNIITLRPVPDKSYSVRVNAYKRPTMIIDSGESPELKQWWQYLAYGASKKIFEDSQDPLGQQSIMQGFKEQERLVLRRTIVERTNDRTATIYSEMTQGTYNNNQGRF